MSSTQVGAVLRHIRQLAKVRKDHELPDHQLLERFARQRDESAFAALLGRHGPMVLGVCRSVLHDLHDAEDAFQAAFLLLAQKAGSIHRREAVSGWLYRVAYHLAVRAKANAARRRVLEKRAVTIPSADPVLDLSLREVRAMLFEELRGLPEQYRAPVVLCGLEEKPLDEAARLLGWTKGTVKGRLQRGRALLRARLRRRGLELPVGLAATALALHSASGKVSAALADSTLRAAVRVAAGGGVVAGVVSAEVAALVQGASKSMFSSKAKIATILVLAMTIAASAFGVLRHRAAAADPAAPAQCQVEKPNPQPGSEAEGTIEVRGRVLDPEGKPVAGAKLYLAQSTPDGPVPSEQATSGMDGGFRFAFSGSEPEKSTEEKLPSQVMAVAEGHGCDWAAFGPGDEELTLRLVKDVPISGRVLDLDGKPVAGAKVRVLGVAAYPGEDLTKMLEETRLHGFSRAAGKQWEGPLPGQAKVLTAGGDGRFRLAGVGRERTVRLAVEGPGITYAPIEVMTRAGETVLGPEMPKGSRRARVYGAAFDYLAEPSRLIRGVVRDKDTGKPVAGVTFWSYLTTHRPQTDKEGRYELLGHPKAPTYQLYLVPPDGRHFRIRVQVSDTLGLDPLAADIALPSGITVQGRALDKASGEPVPGVRVSYYVLFSNPKAVQLGDYHEHEGLSAATTGPDGSYVLTVLPGPGVLAAAAQPPSSYRPALVTPKELEDFHKERPERFSSQDLLPVHGTGAVANAAGPSFLRQTNYNALALINPQEGDKALARDLVLLPPLSRTGTVVGPDGEPLAGVMVVGLEASPGITGWHSNLKSASFTVRGLHPERTRELFFYYKEKDSGRFLELRGEDAEPLKVELQPCGSVVGRLVDKGGKPVGGTIIYFCRHGYGTFFPGSFHVKTDQDGRFRAEGLVPGQKYTMTRHASNLGDTLPSEVTVESGKEKELGDLAVSVASP
jgi:RNA polymerase sigma factor (sigma-70 family)